MSINNKIRVNSIDLNFFLDNNGNLYFEHNNNKYQVIINKNNLIELDEGGYDILTTNDVNNILNRQQYTENNFDDINTFNIIYSDVCKQMPSRKDGLTKSLYEFEYLKNDKKYIYTESKENIPVLLTIQIYTNSLEETFIYSRETGSTDLIKYNLNIINNKLECSPEININKKNKVINNNLKNINLGQFIKK